MPSAGTTCGREAFATSSTAFSRDRGLLRVEATKVGDDTFLSEVVELVEEAQGTTVPIQALTDRITNYFVPTVLALAGLSFLLWWLTPRTDAVCGTDHNAGRVGYRVRSGSCRHPRGTAAVYQRAVLR